MGATKLCLLLLLGTTLAQQDVESEQSSTCPWSKRFRPFKQYVYDYEAESLTGAIGTETGTKVSCKVLLDVVQPCRFSMQTTDCSLNTLSELDAEGRPVYLPAEGSDAFKDAMATNVLKIEIERSEQVQIFPAHKEPKNILNIKRGIFNTLLSPVVVASETRSMPTVFGICPSDISVMSSNRGVTVKRDIQKCSEASAKKMPTSPLALITGMESPLSKMLSSQQTCDFSFDKQLRIMNKCTCSEKHVFQPLPTEGAHGLTAEVKQTMLLRDTISINDRTFDPVWENSMGLTMEVVEDKSPSQNKDSVITTLQRLRSLSQTPDSQERAAIFNKLVSELRDLKSEVLTTAADEMMDISSSLTVQALVQCGTPECTRSFLKVLKTFENSPVQVDATVYALGMLQAPSESMVMDMLDMARHRKSRPVMYALGKTVRKLYEKLGTTTPEMTEVYKFITSILGTDCAGEKDLTYLTLRVLGNIGDAMVAVDPAIENTLVKCMRQPATTLSVQLAAIQAFRRMSLTPEVRSNLQRVSQYPKGAVQKRLAAYLVLMSDPQDTDMEMVKKLLTQEQNTQIKAFVSSHIYNIISSTDPDLYMIGNMIKEALQDTDVSTNNDFKNSRSYDLSLGYDNTRAAVFGNIIFDPSNQLPREAMLETTLKVFGFEANVWEVGMEGKGFEPSIEALFGKNGFFPDTVSKAIYWAEDKMPPNMKEVLEKWFAPFKTPGQKIPENIGKEIVRNFNKLMKDLQSQESPEAMAYLRSMGEELGYIKGADLKTVAENAAMFADLFMRVLPATVMKNLMSRDDHDIFAHYMFMDNKFMMPTSVGLPLTFAMTGTFAPGAKGGFRISPNMKELVFEPSAGVEFVTRMGIHVPEFVMTSVERHTTLYHESMLEAKLSMSQGEVKLSLPTPKNAIKLLRVSNKVVIVGNDNAVKIPDTVEESTCKPVLYGVKLCIKTLRTESGGLSLIGDNVLALDIMPTNEVSEYTATIAYQLRQEKDEKIDSLTMALSAEGATDTDAMVVMTYNRNSNIFLSEVQVPDLNVELGFKVSMTNSDTEGKSITLQVLDNKLPHLTLTGVAKVNSLTDGELRVEMDVLSINTNAAITARLNKVDGITMELKSEVKVIESTSVQSVIFKYGEEHAEVQLVSNVNGDIEELEDALVDWLHGFVEPIMDQQLMNTDMKLSHIVKKGVEASKIWMEKNAKDAPYVETLKSTLTNLEIPKRLFMDLDTKFRYKFNKDNFIITVPLPLGGKSSEELRIPPKVTSPQISLPQVGMDLAPTEIQIPTFTIPTEYDLSLPLMGMVDMSAKVRINSYSLETTFSAGNDTTDSMSYTAKFNMMTESPINAFSFSTGVDSKLMETEDEGLKFSLDGDLKHMFVKAGVSVLETISITDSVQSTGKYNIYVTSPLGLDTSLTVTPKFSLAPSILSIEANSDGRLTVGSLTASTTYVHIFSADRLKKEVKLENNLKVTSDYLKISNKIDGSYAKEGLLLESVTDLQTYGMKHKTKMNLSYKDIKLTMLCDSVTKADGKLFRSQVEALATDSQATLRIENEADDGDNRGYSLITGTINPSGVEVNTDASLVFLTRVASHKGTFSLNKNGLTTSCTTTAQNRPMTFENVFHGAVDTSGVSTSLTTKGSYKENKAELNIEGKIATTEISFNSIVKGNIFDGNARNRVVLKLNGDGLLLSNNMVGSFRDMRSENTHSLSLADTTFTLVSKTDNVLDKRNSYKHDIKVEMVPFTATVVVKNDLKIMEVNFVNDAQFKAEPMKMELVGTLMGVYSEEELKHTYELKFADMLLSSKCNTNGKLLGTHVSHTADVEVAGLSVKFNDVANINSPSLRLESTVKTVAEPFTLNIDAIFNSDGKVSFYGQHSGEIYSKFLLKAEPLLCTQSFEYRASTTHEQENMAPLRTSIDNKYDSILSLSEQRFTLRIKSNVNDNTFDQEFKSYNDAEKMGVEMNGVLSTALLSESSEQYSISGFLKYDKNSNSHFILVPLEKYLPALVENVMSTMTELMQNSIQMVKDMDSEYMVSAIVKNKLSDLKDAIDNFNFNLLIKDIRQFLNSAEKAVTNMIAKFPSEQVVNAVKSIMETIMTWLKEHGVANKFSAIYTKMENILSEFEIEKMIEAIMDEIVRMMKHFQVREKIQSVFAALKSVELRPLFKKALSPVKNFVNALYDFDFQQMINDVSNYLDQMMEKIKSFNYEVIFTELKEKTGHIVVPCFGKLHGEFNLKSPHYVMMTTAVMENSTTSSETPEFNLGLKSKASSTLKILDYTVDASLQLTLPHESPVTISEKVTVDSSCFTLDYKATSKLSDESSVVSETTAKVTTELYTAELGHTFSSTSGAEVSTESVADYKHVLNFPPLGIFSEAQMNSKAVLQFKDGSLHLTFENLASDKCAVMSLSDTATHKSSVDLVTDFDTAKVTFNGETSFTGAGIIQTLTADMNILDHLTITAKAETETPFMKNSVAEVKFQANAGNMKIDFEATHSAEMIGVVEGPVSNMAVAMIKPNMLMFTTENKGNAKVALPFKLSGKLDLQNDISLTLDSRVHQLAWKGLAKFNQYKYYHHFTLENNNEEIQVSTQINGEANLDFLDQTITIPEIKVPYFDRRIPRRESFNLWKDTDLDYYLVTPQQMLDINSKLKYKKNPEVIKVDLEPVMSNLEQSMRVLSMSYDKAKAEYYKYSKDLPSSFRVPAYRIPVMDVEMSSFAIALPDTNVLSSTFSGLTLPKVTLPIVRTVEIPKLGDLTYEMAIKTAMVTAKANAFILNKDNIEMKLDVSLSSGFNLLEMDVQGNSNINSVDRGLKATSTFSLKHDLVEMAHDSSVLLSWDKTDASIRNAAKIDWFFRPNKFNHTITLNSEDGLVVSLLSPSAGRLSFQMQTESPAHVKARLYGGYRSKLSTDIDILGLHVDLRRSEMPIFETTYNMEIPNSILVETKRSVRGIANLAVEIVRFGGEELMRLKKNIPRAVRDSRIILERASNQLADVRPSEILANISDNTLIILQEYQTKVKAVLDAVYRFLKETKFHVPGYNRRLSGFEIYNKFTKVVAEVCEEAVERIPEYFKLVCDYILSIELPHPVSDYVLRAREICNEVSESIPAYKRSAIDFARKVANIKLEDIMIKISEVTEFMYQQSEKFVQTLKSLNVDQLSAWFTEVYNDIINCPHVEALSLWLAAQWRWIVEFFNL